MGFTIDMVTGYVSDITNGADMEKIGDSEPCSSLEKSSKRKPSKIGSFESLLPQERLLPVAETFTHERSPDAYAIPESLIDRDIDSFIEEIAP